MLKKLPALLGVLGLIVLIGLTNGCSAEKKDEKKVTQKAATKGNAVRREVVNVSVKRPSHVIVKPGATFTTGATVTAAYSGKTSGGATVTSTFDGVVRKVERDGKLIIRLNCTKTDVKLDPKDSTTGDLTVTVSEGGATDTTTVTDVLGDDDADACP